MRNFLYRFYAFMEGRYGKRALSGATQYLLAAIYLVLVLVNFFAHSKVITAIEFVFIGITIFRALSKNIPAREKEDRMVADFFFRAKAQKENSDRNRAIRKQEREKEKERKADKDHVYKECPHCKAMLKLPRKKGKHTVRCPRCNQDFEIHVR